MKRKPAMLLFTLGGLFIALAFLTQKAAAASCFTDTGGHWAETFVCWLKTNNLSGGYPDGSFKPDNNITRAEVAVFMQKVNDLAVSQDATNLTAAKSYTDTQDATNLTAAKTYTDGKLHDMFANQTLTVGVGPQAWRAGGFTDNNKIYFGPGSATFVVTTNPNIEMFMATIPFPTEHLGLGVKPNAVEVCFETGGTAVVQEISVREYYYDGNVRQSVTNDNNGAGWTNTVAVTCVQLAFTDPETASWDDYMSVTMTVDFPDIADNVSVYALTGGFFIDPNDPNLP